MEFTSGDTVVKVEWIWSTVGRITVESCGWDVGDETWPELFGCMGGGMELGWRYLSLISGPEIVGGVWKWLGEGADGDREVVGDDNGNWDNMSWDSGSCWLHHIIWLLWEGDWKMLPGLKGNCTGEELSKEWLEYLGEGGEEERYSKRCGGKTISDSESVAIIEIFKAIWPVTMRVDQNPTCTRRVEVEYIVDESRFEFPK